MKIENTTPEGFKPILITIETKEEAEYLKSLVGNLTGNGKGRELTDRIFDFLNKNDIPCKTLIKGDLKWVE